mgnify:CR=1 FL=1
MAAVLMSGITQSPYLVLCPTEVKKRFEVCDRSATVLRLRAQQGIENNAIKSVRGKTQQRPATAQRVFMVEGIFKQHARA